MNETYIKRIVDLDYLGIEIDPKMKSHIEHIKSLFKDSGLLGDPDLIEFGISKELPNGEYAYLVEKYIGMSNQAGDVDTLELNCKDFDWILGESFDNDPNNELRHLYTLPFIIMFKLFDLDLKWEEHEILLQFDKSVVQIHSQYDFDEYYVTRN